MRVAALLCLASGASALRHPLRASPCPSKVHTLRATHMLVDAVKLPNTIDEIDALLLAPAAVLALLALNAKAAKWERASSTRAESATVEAGELRSLTAALDARLTADKERALTKEKLMERRAERQGEDQSAKLARAQRVGKEKLQRIKARLAEVEKELRPWGVF